MKIVEPGHVYELSSLDGDHQQLLTFVAREFSNNRVHPGTQTQDVIRCLIDRTKHCDDCLRWEGNDLIIKHLRMALVLHEARALIRKTEKGYIEPEKIATGDDGHFLLSEFVERRKEMKWTTTPPTEDGWYWAKIHKEAEPVIILVNGSMAFQGPKTTVAIGYFEYFGNSKLEEPQ